MEIKQKLLVDPFSKLNYGTLLCVVANYSDNKSDSARKWKVLQLHNYYNAY